MTEYPKLDPRFAEALAAAMAHNEAAHKEFIEDLATRLPTEMTPTQIILGLTYFVNAYVGLVNDRHFEQVFAAAWVTARKSRKAMLVALQDTGPSPADMLNELMKNESPKQ